MLVIVAVLWATCALVNGSGMSANERGDSAKTDWFVAAKYGVFVHYLNSIQNNPDHVASLGKQTDWDECVRELDVEKFAERMEQAGVDYGTFTMMQLRRHLIAPNATFDRLTGYQPGQACATRDLVEDLYAALHQRGIPLMPYWTGDGPPGRSPRGRRAGLARRWPGDGRVRPKLGGSGSRVRLALQGQGLRVLGRWLLSIHRI